MRGNEFLEKMGLIAPEYIEEAEAKQKRRKNPWLKWLAAAACICILAGVVLSVDFYEPPQEPETSAPGEGPPNFTENGIKYFISPMRILFIKNFRKALFMRAKPMRAVLKIVRII